jgi:hypothetical protein
MNFIGIDQLFWFKTAPAILSNLALVLFAILKRPPLFRYLLVFALTTLADILVASKILAMPNDSAQVAVEYLFVLIGDLRFILLLAYFLYAGLGAAELQRLSLPGSVIKPAFVFTLFPTILVGAVGFAKPPLLSEARHKFLAYELIFFCLTALWIYVVLPQKSLPAASARFIKSAAIPVSSLLWPVVLGRHTHSARCRSRLRNPHCAEFSLLQRISVVCSFGARFFFRRC